MLKLLIDFVKEKIIHVLMSKQYFHTFLFLILRFFLVGSGLKIGSVVLPETIEVPKFALISDFIATIIS